MDKSSASSNSGNVNKSHQYQSFDELEESKKLKAAGTSMRKNTSRVSTAVKDDLESLHSEDRLSSSSTADSTNLKGKTTKLVLKPTHHKKKTSSSSSSSKSSSSSSSASGKSSSSSSSSTDSDSDVDSDAGSDDSIKVSFKRAGGKFKTAIGGGKGAPQQVKTNKEFEHLAEQVDEQILNMFLEIRDEAKAKSLPDTEETRAFAQFDGKGMSYQWETGVYKIRRKDGTIYEGTFYIDDRQRTMSSIFRPYQNDIEDAFEHMTKLGEKGKISSGVKGEPFHVNRSNDIIKTPESYNQHSKITDDAERAVLNAELRGKTADALDEGYNKIGGGVQKIPGFDKTKHLNNTNVILANHKALMDQTEAEIAKLRAAPSAAAFDRIAVLQRFLRELQAMDMYAICAAASLRGRGGKDAQVESAKHLAVTLYAHHRAKEKGLGSKAYEFMFGSNDTEDRKAYIYASQIAALVITDVRAREDFLRNQVSSDKGLRGIIYREKFGAPLTKSFFNPFTTDQQIKEQEEVRWQEVDKELKTYQKPGINFEVSDAERLFMETDEDEVENILSQMLDDAKVNNKQDRKAILVVVRGWQEPPLSS